MQSAVFSWQDSFVIPATLCFRPTPSGGLQVASDAGQPHELATELISLLPIFSRARTAAAAFSVAADGWELERWAAAYLWSFGKKNGEVCRACRELSPRLHGPIAGLFPSAKDVLARILALRC
jgi:hypothetical protein